MKKTLTRVLAAVLAGGLGLVPAFGATYYVKPTGNDAADGLSNATAWATIARVNSATLAPGDQVLFRAGMVFRDATLVPSRSGALGNPIVYGAYGTGAKPILTTAIALPSSGWTDEGGNVYSRPLATVTRMVTVNNTYMVRATSAAALADGQYFWDAAALKLYVKDPAGNPNTSGKTYDAAQRDYVVNSESGKLHIKFTGLRFEKSNYGLAVLDSNSHYHTFENCEFYFASSNGQRAGAGILANRCHFVRVEKCRLSWLEGDGIFVQSGSNAEIIGNEIDHLFDFGGDNGPDCIQISGLRRDADNFVIKDNIVRRESTTTAKGCIIVGTAPKGGIISGNSVYKGTFGIACYAPNTVIEYNYCEDIGTSGAIRMWENLGGHDVTVRYNVVNGCPGGPGIVVGNLNPPATPQWNINVYNNLFYNVKSGATYQVAVSGTFANNIIWTPTANPARRIWFNGFIDGDPLVSDNNIIQDQGTAVFARVGSADFYSMAEYRAAFPSLDANSKTDDPQFVNAAAGDFHLQASSPAIDTGVNIAPLPQPLLDYDGNPVPSGLSTDMGPYERGDLLAYEGFDYPVGAFTVADGGQGWTGAWVISGSLGVTESVAGSLAWTGVAATGNHFRIYDGDGVSQEIKRTLRKSFGSHNETYWIAFLVKKLSSGREAVVDFGGLTFRATNGDWTVKTPATSYAAITGANYANLHLIVARVDAGATGDTVRVWADPVVANGEPSDATALVTLTDPGFVFNTVAIRHGPFGNHLQSAEWDELRLGKTFGSVTGN